MAGRTDGARLDGRRVVITGAARGIGAEIAARAAAEGARVAIIDILAELGRAHAERIGGVFHEADLAVPDAARGAVEAAIGDLGGVDVLVNCAGVLELAPLLEITPESWDRVLAVNARAVLVTMQVAAQRMIADGHGGRIVNISSMAAKTGGEQEAHYAASKAAVLALTRVAALEWGAYGITVNAVCPGYVLTDLAGGTRTDDDVAAWTAMSPLGRLGTPGDVAGLVAFLASDDAGYMTGQAVNVTGGMVMH